MKHIVGLSGGKDSTAMALWLAENQPRDYEYICTPTGEEQIYRRHPYKIAGYVAAGMGNNLCQEQNVVLMLQTGALFPPEFH